MEGRSPSSLTPSQPVGVAVQHLRLGAQQRPLQGTALRWRERKLHLAVADDRC